MNAEEVAALAEAIIDRTEQDVAYARSLLHKGLPNMTEEEKEQLMWEYNLDEDDIETIVDKYYLDYRDSSIVGSIFKDYYDLGYEEAWALGYVNHDDSIVSRYFDIMISFMIRRKALCNK